jgi:aconitate decarboxylase
MTPSITRDLCEKIYRAEYSSLSPLLLERMKMILLDSIGVAIAGSRQPPIGILIRILAAAKQKTGCTIFGHQFKTSARVAGLINGASMHVLDFEPMWNPPTHICSSVLPGILALAEEKRSSGKELLLAFAIALEVEARLLLALNNYSIPTTFHPPSIVGPLACAAGCSKLLGLEPQAIASSLGIAASASCGLMANAGTMTKCLNTGRACRSGVEATQLAALGYIANEEIIEHPRGFLHAFTKGESAADHFSEFMNPHWLEVQPPAIKHYPCQFVAQSAVDAALTLRPSVLSHLSSVQKITIEFPVIEYLNRPHPLTFQEAQFSLHFLIAAALIYGEVTIDSYSPRRLKDEAMHRLMSLISLEYNPKWAPHFDSIHGNLTIRLKDGSSYTQSCIEPLGHWNNPLDSEKREMKFATCMKNHFSEKKIEKIKEMALNLEELSNVGSFVRQLK